MAKFISLFSGCGGIDLGMEQAGHECVAQVEWDKNAAGVLKHRWPNVPLFCDVSKVTADDLPDADFITYGFPCQDLSVAGKREGLDGKRSGLFYEATRLIRELIARGSGLRFALAENVRGALSADDGLALARCIRELLDCGACEVGYVVLDSQYFGVAQRRKRVFIISDFGGESCDEILAITESLPGHPAPSREAGKRTAGDATKGVGEHVAIEGVDWYNNAVTGDINHTLKIGGDVPGVIEDKKSMSFAPSDLKRGFGQKPEIELSGTLKKEHNDQSPHVATYEWHNQDSRIREQQQASTLSCNAGGKEGNLVRENLTVRRLTPIECERLQGFPDNWTSEKMELILEGNEWKATGKVLKQADGPRYKAMGNAVTVNVAEWIGKQIGKVLNETK